MRICRKCANISGHPGCRFLLISSSEQILRNFAFRHLLTMDTLQWMGAVRTRVQTADKNHNNPQEIHTTPVHQLMSWVVNSFMFIWNKSIIFVFLTSNGHFCLQTQVLISEAGNWWTIGCWLLVDYCDVFISCLDSHSDGTHSLQRIHWWASNAKLHFYKSEEHEEAWRNKLIYIFNGLSVYFSKCTFLGELLL